MNHPNKKHAMDTLHAFRPRAGVGRVLTKLLTAALLSAGAALAWAQPATLTHGQSSAAVGEVVSVSGLAFAQSPGQAPRSLVRGEALREGDRLTTVAQGSAVIALQDGTRMTLRPKTDMVLTQYRFAAAQPDDGNMVVNLLRGGLRTITGLISKNNPEAARIRARTATIGIRGTDFDVRDCEGAECAQESQNRNTRAREQAITASARLVQVRGLVQAQGPQGAPRTLSVGAAVYPGETVLTAAGAQAVMAFQDDSRVTLGADTRFRVDQFQHDRAQPGAGRFLVSLLKGSLRALTGQVAKANPGNVAFRTSTATVGIRGTGLDMVCEGPCADEPPQPGDSGTGFRTFTWQGQTVVQPQDGAPPIVLNAGEGLQLNPPGQPPQPLPSLEMPETRPDTVPVPDNLFSQASVEENREGVFVFVRDGTINMQTDDGRTLVLGRNEVGFSGLDGTLVRPSALPVFMEFDPTPMPNTSQLNLRTLLRDARLPDQEVCR